MAYTAARHVLQLSFHTNIAPETICQEMTAGLEWSCNPILHALYIKLPNLSASKPEANNHLCHSLHRHNLPPSEIPRPGLADTLMPKLSLPIILAENDQGVFSSADMLSRYYTGFCARCSRPFPRLPYVC